MLDVMICIQNFERGDTDVDGDVPQAPLVMPPPLYLEDAHPLPMVNDDNNPSADDDGRRVRRRMSAESDPSSPGMSPVFLLPLLDGAGNVQADENGDADDHDDEQGNGASSSSVPFTE